MLTPTIALALATFAGTPIALGNASIMTLAATDPDKHHAQVDLVCEQTELVPGSTANVGVHFKLDPHWHVYWHGRSDAGGPIEITLNLPAGYSAGATQWPAPKRLVSPGDILDHVYEDEVTLIVPVKVPPTASGKASFSGKVSYVICSSACVMEDATLSLSLPVAAAGTKPADSKQAKLFAATRSHLPKALPTGDTAPSVRRDGKSIALEAPGAKGLTFFPGEESITLTDLIKSGQADGSKLTLQAEPDADMKLPLDGVLEVRYPDSRGTVWYLINVPAPGGPTPMPLPTKSDSGKSDPKSPH